MQKLFNSHWFLVAVFLYIIPSFFLPAIFDVQLFETVGVKILERTDFYTFDRPTHATFPFLPLLVWPYALFHFLSLQTGLDFVIFVRLMVILFVFATALMVPQKTRVWILFNPIVYMTSAVHGQADMILIFFALLSIHLESLKKSFLAGFFMAISTFVKNWSVIFLPLMFFTSKNKVPWVFGFLGIASVLLGVYIRFFHSNLNYILEAFFSHAGGAPGYWGITGILNLLGFSTTTVFEKSIFILATTFSILYLWILIKRLDVKLSILLLVLVFIVVTPGWGMQYAAWPIPFALLTNQVSKVKVYTFLGSIYLLVSYFQTYAYQFRLFADSFEILTKLSILLAVPLWLFTVYWFATLIYNSANGQDS